MKYLLLLAALLLPISAMAQTVPTLPATGPNNSAGAATISRTDLQNALGNKQDYPGAATKSGTWVSGHCLQASGTTGAVADAGAACGSGSGGSVTWPATGNLVVSNSTSSPPGLAPVNGNCVVGSGGAWTAGSCGGGAVGMELDFFYSGIPYANGLLAKTFSRATTVAASAAVKCNAIVGATASVTVTFVRIPAGTSSPTTVGTAVFGATGGAYQGCTATWTSSVAFAAGDILTVTFPGTADVTLGNIAISIPGTQ